MWYANAVAIVVAVPTLADIMLSYADTVAVVVFVAASIVVAVDVMVYVLSAAVGAEADIYQGGSLRTIWRKCIHVYNSKKRQDTL